MDPRGPTVAYDDGGINIAVGGYSSNSSLGAINPGNTATSTGLRAGLAQGVWFSTSFVNSSVEFPPFSAPYAGSFYGLDHMFIMNLTLRPGASAPTTQGLVVNVRDGAEIDHPTAPGHLGALRFGIKNAHNNSGLWSQSYYLDWMQRVVIDLSVTFNGGTSYAIYIVAIPAPGAGFVLLAAMPVPARRRPPRGT